MLTAMSANSIRMPALKTVPTKLSMGDHTDRLSMACFQIAKPTSTMPDGVIEEMPEACSPILDSDWMIEFAKLGPLRSNQRKKPKKQDEPDELGKELANVSLT